MRIFVFLHVFTMFSAVAIGYGSVFLVAVAARRRDVPALRGVLATTKRIERIIGPLFLLGIVLGIVAVFANNFNPLAPWLVIAYVLAALATISGIVVLGPWLAALGVAAADSSDDAPSPQLEAVIRNRRWQMLVVLDVLIVVALIADMVLKPFS